MFETSVIDSEQGLESLRLDWEGLLDGNPNGTIFSTWEWAVAWWKSYGAGKKLWILRVVRDGTLIGLAPLYQHTLRRFRSVNYRTLRLLGDGSGDSDYLGLVSAPGEEREVAESVADYVLSHRSVWDIILLNEVPKTSETLNYLRRCLQENNCYWSESEIPCCYIDLPQDWNTYLMGLRPRMRTKIRSLTRQLKASFKVDFSVCQEPRDVGRKLESLFRLHAMRWSTKGQEGVFIAPAKRRFYQYLSGLLLERRWLRFYTLAVDDVIVAHQYCFEYRNTVFLLQEGFDPQWDRYGVGNVLRSYVLRDCIDRKISTYDFLGGVTPHKLSWGAMIKTSVRAMVGAPVIKNAVLFRVPKVIDFGKRGMKFILPEAVMTWAGSLRRG